MRVTESSSHSGIYCMHACTHHSACLYCILTALMHGTVILIILNARDSCCIVISGVLSRSVGRHLKQRSCSPRGAPRAPQTGTQHVCSRVGVGACERGGQDKERVRGVGENTTRPIPIQMYDIQIHTNRPAGYGYTAVWV